MQKSRIPESEIKNNNYLNINIIPRIACFVYASDSWFEPMSSAYVSSCKLWVLDIEISCFLDIRMSDGFLDVLVFLDVWMSGWFGFLVSTKNHSVLFSVLLMFDVVDVGAAARLEFCVILNLGLSGLLEWWQHSSKVIKCWPHVKWNQNIAC